MQLVLASGIILDLKRAFILACWSLSFPSPYFLVMQNALLPTIIIAKCAEKTSVELLMDWGLLQTNAKKPAIPNGDPILIGVFAGFANEIEIKQLSQAA
jgi:hypothetical protein